MRKDEGHIAQLNLEGHEEQHQRDTGNDLGIDDGQVGNVHNEGSRDLLHIINTNRSESPEQSRSHRGDQRNDEGIEQTRVEEIGRLIAARTEEVSHMRFVSAEEAWEWYQKEYFGDQREEFLEGYPTNPLADSFNYEVYLKDVAKQEQLITYIESIPGVRHVNSDTVANTLSGVNLLISYVSIGIIIILLAVSVFLISNTVTVGISVRQEEINIMKYIGATDYLVRAPFIIEGMLIGLIGAVIPLLIIYNMYSTVLAYMMEKFTMLSQLLEFLPVETIYDFLLPVSLLVGIGIGFLGSVTTVRKHIKV